ncbi:NusG domain II-containing protein [candidate division KSB1 bacterium]|nr:NusG domain II-containing protein [candidate division KSB1 bacterium]
MKPNKPHIADYLLTALLFLLCLGAFLPLHSMRNILGDTAILYENGKTVESISLKNDRIFRYKEIEIEVETGSIRINESDCPHKICVHSGKISSPAQHIVCVPNKVMIEIVSDKPSEINAVSY